MSNLRNAPPTAYSDVNTDKSAYEQTIAALQDYKLSTSEISFDDGNSREADNYTSEEGVGGGFLSLLFRRR